MAVVTFTTDFGTADAYAAVMKGVVLSLAPDAVLVDVTHAIPAQDIQAAAFVLEQAAPCFPRGSIHVAAVDAGVPGERSTLVVQARDQVFIGPDNGVLSLAVRPPYRAFRVENPAFRAEPGNASFPGGDAFGAAAGRLASGIAAAEAGPGVASIVQLDLPEPQPLADGARGVIVHADHFGNLITSFAATAAPGRWRLVCGNADIELSAGRAYGDVEPGKLLLYPGSTGRMELALRGGSAAAFLNARSGSALQLWRIL